MKTGMEAPLIGLVILVALGFLWNMWSGLQVDLAVAATNATAAGNAVPTPVLIGGQWIVNALVGTLIGGFVTAFLAWLIPWTRRRWQEVTIEERKWKSGPNANYGRQPAGPKAPSESELYRMMLMQQMGGGQRSTSARLEGENEPTITF